MIQVLNRPDSADRSVRLRQLMQQSPSTVDQNAGQGKGDVETLEEDISQHFLALTGNPDKLIVDLLQCKVRFTSDICTIYHKRGETTCSIRSEWKVSAAKSQEAQCLATW